MNRGEREGVLRVVIEMPEEAILQYLKRHWIKARDAKTAAFLEDMLLDAYKRLLAPALEREIRRQLTEVADQQAISVFARNLDALMTSVRDVSVGDCPGFRTGCKAAPRSIYLILSRYQEARAHDMIVTHGCSWWRGTVWLPETERLVAE